MSTEAKTEPNPYGLDLTQTTKACKVLQEHVINAKRLHDTGAQRPNLLVKNEDLENEEDNTPIWMILTGKKHIVDKTRLKPRKIQIPYPLNDKSNSTICLITADPQRVYKDTITSPAFPKSLSSRITRVIGLSKLKAKYKSFESRRQLVAEYDHFLADSRIITYLPQVLGKVFYRGGAKRPVPLDIGAVDPPSVAKEIQKALSSAIVHLSTSNTTAIHVGAAYMSPAQCTANIDAVIKGITTRLLPQGWRNVRAIHIKGPRSPSFPIWLASELWVDDVDILEEKKIAGKRGEKLAGSTKQQPAQSIVVTRKRYRNDSATAVRKERMKRQKADVVKTAVAT